MVGLSHRMETWFESWKVTVETVQVEFAVTKLNKAAMVGVIIKVARALCCPSHR